MLAHPLNTDLASFLPTLARLWSWVAFTVWSLWLWFFSLFYPLFWGGKGPEVVSGYSRQVSDFEEKNLLLIDFEIRMLSRFWGSSSREIESMSSFPKQFDLAAKEWWWIVEIPCSEGISNGSFLSYFSLCNYLHSILWMDMNELVEIDFTLIVFRIVEYGYRTGYRRYDRLISY